MPKYVYFCRECEEVFEIRHSLQKTHTICELCKGEGQLERKPAAIFISKKQGNLAGKNRIGDVVKATIEEAKSELTNEQEKLRTRVYKNDK